MSLRQAHGRPSDVRRPPPLLLVSFAEALKRWAKVDVAQQSVEQLRQHCREAGFDVRDGDDEATVLTQVLVEGVEPRLPPEQLIAIDRWPASLASLAQRRPDEPTLADRFEVYWGATELANGFNELVDPAEQRARFRDDLGARAAMGRPEYPIDEQFISALEAGCPPSAGVAVGVDRVLMVLGGYDDIDDVLAFPFERA